MTIPIRNLLGGVATAAILAIAIVTPTIVGVSTWKWVLAVIGLLLWFRAARPKPPRSAP
jgi:hypothetical protein